MYLKKLNLNLSKTSLQTISLLVATLFFGTLFCLVYFDKIPFIAKEATKPTEAKSDKEVSQDKENDTIALPQEEEADRQQKTIDQATLQSLEIPIFMFHYIRDYHAENDQIGQNLSFSPAKFAEELDRLIALGHTTTNFLEINQGRIPKKPVILTFDDGYLDFYQNAYPELKKRGMTATVYIISGKDDGNYLNKSQIAELSANGIEIGSHTRSHPDLAASPLEKARNELVQSKSDLEAIIGKKVISFCFPAGKFTPETIDLARTAGYLYATTTKAGIGKFSTPLELSRYRITPRSTMENFLK